MHNRQSVLFFLRLEIRALLLEVVRIDPLLALGQQAKALQIEIDAKIEDLEQFRGRLVRMNSEWALSAGGARPSGSDSFSKAMAEYLDLETEIGKDLDRLKRLRSHIREKIDQVEEPSLHALLILRHLHGYDWQQVADKMGYSYSHVKGSLYKKALQELRLIPGNTD